MTRDNQYSEYSSSESIGDRRSFEYQQGRERNNREARDTCEYKSSYQDSAFCNLVQNKGCWTLLDGGGFDWKGTIENPKDSRAKLRLALGDAPRRGLDLGTL